MAESQRQIATAPHSFAGHPPFACGPWRLPKEGEFAVFPILPSVLHRQVEHSSDL